MSHLLSTMRVDVTLQARSRLYHIGIGVAVVMGVAVRLFIDHDALRTGSLERRGGLFDQRAAQFGARKIRFLKDEIDKLFHGGPLFRRCSWIDAMLPDRGGRDPQARGREWPHSAIAADMMPSNSL